MACEYCGSFWIECARIDGLEVTPAMPSASIRRCSMPSASILRPRSSSHRLWPSLRNSSKGLRAVMSGTPGSSGSLRRAPALAALPYPIAHLGHVLTPLDDIARMIAELAAHQLAQMGSTVAEAGDPIDHVHD